MNARHLLTIIDSHIASNPSSTPRSLARELDVTVRTIEQAIREADGISFSEYLENRRLAHALKMLEEKRKESMIENHGITRSEPRMKIPGVKVSYLLHGRGIRKSGFSVFYPLFDLSSGGMAFLCDCPLKPGRKVSLSIKCVKINNTLHLEGRAVYAVDTNIPGYRYRIGIRFMSFEAKKGCNPPEALKALARLLGAAASHDAGTHA